MAIFVPRHKDKSLFQVKEWPIHVHVAVPNVPSASDRTRFDDDQYKLVAWAELYDTKDAASKRL
jgi:hypothetical protein